MRQFSFRLEPLVKLREHARTERRADLAQSYEAERILEEEKKRLVVELASLKKHILADASPGVVRVDRLLDVQRYEMVIQSQIQTITLQQVQIQEEIERRREALVEADKEVRVLEKLRAHQEKDFKKSEGRRENRDLDEMASRRHTLAKEVGK